ncbi:AAA family ATPase [bacterium]|nr:AAA family ATPase [bacterium]
MARVIESVVGHQNEISQLFQLKQAGRWPHAVMFVGPSGIGKMKMALAFAQVLVCDESPEACGLCGACIRIEKQQSESLTVIKPDPELTRPVIKVEKIRDLLDSLSLSSMGSARVVIIDQAQTMNPQASNALLKTLEEPSENIFFILITNDVHQFLPTIRSRTQVVRFTALTYDEVKKIKPALPDWTYRSCRGQIDRLELLSSPEGKAQREEALTFFDQFCSDENFLLDKTWKDSVKDRSWAQFSINCWLQMSRDAIILKTQAQKFILNTDQSERLKQLYSLSANKLGWLCQHLIAAERDINANADTSLVFENLWIQYARVD